MTNKRNTVLYTGVTNNLSRRAMEHSFGKGSIFTKKYNVDKLVFFEEFMNIEDAIVSEKRIKGWLRKKKIQLIESINPGWKDLFLSF